MNLTASVKSLAGSALRWAGFVCLNYHRIGDGRESVFDRQLWSATADEFGQQLRWLKRNFDVVTPRDLAYVLRVRRGRHVLLTFDDGYADNYSTAFPILRSHGLPATFFVATGFIDSPRLPWWDEIAWLVRRSAHRAIALPRYLGAPVAFDEPDREETIRTLLRAYKRLPVDQTGAFMAAVQDATGSGPCDIVGGRGLWMTWDMLREMHSGGMTIGGHTVNHQILSRMTRDEQWKEIAGSTRRLEQELGAPVRTFSYPIGKRDSFNADTRTCLREAGIRTAFTYYGGFRPLSRWDDYDIPRFAVEQSTSFDEFRALVLAPWLSRARA